jgi:hypothetical protein
MKNTTIYIFSLLLLLPNVWAQTINGQSFTKRADDIEKFKSVTAPDLTSSTNQKLSELKNYQHENLIKKDKLEISSWSASIEKLNNEMETISSDISLGGYSNKLNQLNEKNNEINKYEEAKKISYEIKNNINNTDRLNKYIEMIDNSKSDVFIKGVYATLPQHEKNLADQYKENTYYVIQNEGVISGRRNEIKNLQNEIDSLLKFQENKMKEFNAKKLEIDTQLSYFQKLKDIHQNQIQYNYTLPSTWQMGLFSCEAKQLPTYIRYKNFPNLVAMRTSIQAETGRSYTVHNVISLDKNSPNQLNMPYKCEKLGSFSSCLDNTEKKLCHLVEDCRMYMNIARLSYDRLKHFNDVKSFYPAEILEKRKSDFQDQNKFNVINEWQKMGKLGYLTADELYQYFNPIIEKTKNMTQSTPEAFMASIKLFINQEKIKAFNNLKSKPGYNSRSSKLTDSKNSIEYIFATIQSELETILNDDKVEARSFELCPTENEDKKIFCTNYAQFKKESSKFNEFEEIPNLTHDECPKLVFRLGEEKTKSKSIENKNAIQD